MYQEIFKQGKIGNITLKNRLVMSPMGTSLAETDVCSSDLKWCGKRKEDWKCIDFGKTW